MDASKKDSRPDRALRISVALLAPTLVICVAAICASRTGRDQARIVARIGQSDHALLFNPLPGASK